MSLIANQVGQERDRQKGIENMAFGILGWIEKRVALGKPIPTAHTWSHLIESNPDYRQLKKLCAKHFGLDLEDKAQASKHYVLSTYFIT